MQQFYGYVVRRAHKRHAAISGRAVDSYAAILQMLAKGIDVVNGIGQVPKISAFTILLRIPVVGELNLRFSVARCREKNEAKATLLIVVAAEFLQAELFAIKLQRAVQVSYPNRWV